MSVLQSLKDAVKKNLIAGTLVLLPIIGTLWVLTLLVQWADSFVISLLPMRFHPETLYGAELPGLGILVTIGLIMIAGLITRLYIGRKLVSLGDKIFSKIPVGRSVYSVIKEFLTGVLGNNDQRFKQVALVEWPRKGCKMLAFVTGFTPGFEKNNTQKEISLFLPTAPNPTSGFFIILPEEDVKILNMSVDTAFKIIISGGIVSGSEKTTNR
ncbi:MAG: hypothetical protein COS89_08825 [Deltaproteobacteria bacterium CG07_land_8_20_14_0_80_38_7]|nr:MAG: hypothetical protein COS89_08825 [Deltaproteobacteria bacterium CG07_land_8_20_14_0_80_38_7]